MWQGDLGVSGFAEYVINVRNYSVLGGLCLVANWNLWENTDICHLESCKREANNNANILKV